MKIDRLSKGFSLVELSGDSVIIGMIVAAITSGAHLMDSARINKVVSEFDGYNEAVDNFRLKYRAWPGDMANADSFWGACGGSNAICNGDADEEIDYNASNDTDESFAAWLHLQNANMIAGSYSGIGGGVANIGTNVPSSAIKIGGYALYYGAAGLTTSNVLVLAAETASNNLTTGALTAADAYLIDTKIDDGSPVAGNLRGAEGNGAADCIDEAATPDVYFKTKTAEACIIGLDLSAS